MRQSTAIRFSFFLLSVICSAARGANTYYVSSSGNDLNSGLSPDQSWATSSHVNAQQFNPGDTVLFERGGLYRGTLRPQGSGTSAAPISVGCYGTGNLPVIDAAGSDAA